MACDGSTRRFLVTLCCDVFLTSSSLSAQAGSLLAVLPGSARAAGMGGAGAAIVGDAGAIFANPAALATIHHLAVEGSYESFPSGSTLSIGALALRVNRFTWGAGAAAFGPSYTSADLLGVSTLVFRTGLGALGATAKYARETVGGARVDAWAGDVGPATAVFDRMALGVMGQEIGGGFGSARDAAWGCDGCRDRAPSAELGPGGAPPAGLGADRRSRRARSGARRQRGRALPRARRGRGGAHPPQAAIDREAGRQSENRPGVAAAPAARVGGPRVRGGFTGLAGG